MGIVRKKIIQDYLSDRRFKKNLIENNVFDKIRFKLSDPVINMKEFIKKNEKNSDIFSKKDINFLLQPEGSLDRKILFT